jgi:hypothetical protein
VTVVSVFVSQPFAALLSQSPNPAVHTGWHALDEQLVVPWLFVHTVVQLPQ